MRSFFVEVRSAARILRFATFLAVAAGCGPQEPAVGLHSVPILYGQDDRHEVFEEEDPRLVDVARATVAWLPPAALDFGEPEALRIRAAPLGLTLGLCGDERFADQPAAAECSGVLIDEDLVLTAGHCVSADSCGWRFAVFGYHLEAEDHLALSDREDVFACRRVAVRVASAPDEQSQLDFAIVQLDRAVSAVAPVPVRPELARVGETVAAVGSVAGTPIKIAEDGTVVTSRTDPRDHFVSSVDAFEAGSGGPVVDADGALLGVLTRGGQDWVDERGCLRARREPDSSGREQATHATEAVRALCEAGWPAQALCGRAPRCGDGVCSSAEDATACPADCPAPVCGDLLCEQSEWSDCPDDCGDRRAPGLPNEWWCPDDWYADGAECDCSCGAADPDCGDPEDPRACTSEGPNGRTPRQIAGGGCDISSARDANRPLPPLVLVAVVVCWLARRRRA